MECGSESTFAKQSAPQHEQMMQFSMRFAQFLPQKMCWLASYTTLARKQKAVRTPLRVPPSLPNPRGVVPFARAQSSEQKLHENRALAMPAWPSSWAAHHQQLTTRSAGATDGCEKSAAPRDAGHLLTNS